MGSIIAIPQRTRVFCIVQRQVVLVQPFPRIGEVWSVNGARKIETRFHRVQPEHSEHTLDGVCLRRFLRNLPKKQLIFIDVSWLSNPFRDRNFAHISVMTIMFLFPPWVDRPAQEKYVPSLAQKRSARQAANHASPGERPKRGEIHLEKKTPFPSTQCKGLFTSIYLQNWVV